MQCFSPYAALQEHASRQPGADAIIIDGTRITYAALLERVTACAIWLLQRGLTPGDVTGICIRDEIGHVVSGRRWVHRRFRPRQNRSSESKPVPNAGFSKQVTRGTET
jgi:hypothetical protein